VFTVEPPFNSQNDQVYAPIDNNKRYIDPSRLLRMSVMVSVAVSQVGMTELIFVNPGVKVNGQLLLRSLAVLADASSNQTCRRTLFIHKTICCLRIGLSSVLRPLQHSIGYMGDGFYRSNDPTNSIKVLKEKAVKENNPKNRKKQKLHICIHTQNSRQIQRTTITQQVP